MSSPYLGIAHIAAAQNQPEVTANDAFDDLDTALNAEASFALTDASTAITLTQAQMATGFVLKLTGTLTAGRNAIVPAIARFFAVVNASTGGFAVTVKTSSGIGIAVAVGTSPVILYCDGTNVLAASTSAAVPNFADAEVVSMSGTSGTLANSPSPAGSLILVQRPAAGGAIVLIAGGVDYTLSGASITTNNPIPSGDTVYAWYRH